MSRQTSTQVTTSTDQQVQELIRWGVGVNFTDIVRTAIDRLWLQEATRRGEISEPWVVEPGHHVFRSLQTAEAWLRESQEAIEGRDGWATMDEYGEPETWWDMRPLRFER